MRYPNFLAESIQQKHRDTRVDTRYTGAKSIAIHESIHDIVPSRNEETERERERERERVRETPTELLNLRA